MLSLQVNHFERKNIDGVEHWFWEDTPGSQCGRTREWRYRVQVGDSCQEAGSCPQGYTFYALEISGTPERL